MYILSGKPWSSESSVYVASESGASGFFIPPSEKFLTIFSNVFIKSMRIIPIVRVLSVALLFGVSHGAGSYYNHAKNVTLRISSGVRRVIDSTRTLIVSKVPLPIHAITDNRFNKQFARSKLARGSALSSKCNSRCSAKTPCNKRCQLARDRYQLDLAKKTYLKTKVSKYTSTQLNQRFYSGQVSKNSCNSRCQAAKTKYQKQKTQYEKTFHEPCQNGHLKNKGTLNGKPLSDQGNPSGDTPGDKTTVGGYGGVAKGRPLGAPGAGQINWANSAKYNWRTDCKSYSSVYTGVPNPGHKPSASPVKSRNY